MVYCQVGDSSYKLTTQHLLGINWTESVGWMAKAGVICEWIWNGESVMVNITQQWTLDGD